MTDFEMDRRKKRLTYFVKVCRDLELEEMAEVIEKILGEEKLINKFYTAIRKWII